MSPIMIPQFRNRTIAVMGLGRSGMAALKALHASGARVLAWDDDEQAREQARQPGISINPLEDVDFQRVDALVLAPGIALDFPSPHPVVRRARDADCPIMGEAELLALAETGASMIGITGTNGKSTTTALIAHILRHAGKVAHAGGNLGVPASALPVLKKGQFYVLEMSSFQLELCHQLSFDPAILLNIGTDHIERHGSLEGLIRAKERIFRHARTAIIGVDDPHGVALSEKLPHQTMSEKMSQKMKQGMNRRIPISISRKVKGGVYGHDGGLFDAMDGAAKRVVDMADLPLVGEHNIQNYAAAYACARMVGCRQDAIIAGLQSFAGLPHRLENVGTWRGVRFVNDSKATNFLSVLHALKAHRDIFWIAGGRLKNEDFSILDDVLSRVRQGFFIGEAADLFHRRYSRQFPCHRCHDMDDAVAQAADQACAYAGEIKNQATVLLSPAGTSFDVWQSFEQRGDAFRESVHKWAGHRRMPPLTSPGTSPSTYTYKRTP